MTRGTAVTLAVIFAAGVLVRVPRLSDPPLRYPTRQYRSAILARGYFLDRVPGLTDQQRTAARVLAGNLPPIEPPILEHTAAWLYRAIGREDLRIPRAISVIAWSLGGVALARVALAMFSPPAALVAVFLMMFLPFGIITSQWFTPDPLMTALVVATWAAAVRHAQRRSAASLVLLTLAAEAAIAVKPMAAFFCVPAACALQLRRLGAGRTALFAVVWTAVLAILPALYYFGFVARVAPGVIEHRIFPQLLATRGYWVDWARMIHRATTLPIALAGLAGTILAPAGLRLFLAVMWLGYFAFGVTFTHHIHTHDYYSLPLIPIVAVSVGALVHTVGRRLPSRIPARLVMAAVAVIAAAGLWTSVTAAEVFRSPADLHAEIARYARIGELCEHSTRVVSLDGNYGYPLGYHALIVPSNLPLSIDVSAAALSGAASMDTARLAPLRNADFFVGTHRIEFDAQPGLLAHLDQFPIIFRDGPPDQWKALVYDLRVARMRTWPERLTVFADATQTVASQQVVRLHGPAAVAWRADVSQSDLFHVEPPAGSGPATLRIVPHALSAGVDALARVTIRKDGYPHPIGGFDVRFRSVAQAGTAPPFGHIDSPPESATIGPGGVTFAGWALDDFDLRRVWAVCATADGRLIELGEARRTGSRADLTAAFPLAHDLMNAGWFFTLETEMLDRIVDPREIVFFAEDGQEHRAEIGRRRLAGTR